MDCAPVAVKHTGKVKVPLLLSSGGREIRNKCGVSRWEAFPFCFFLGKKNKHIRIVVCTLFLACYLFTFCTWSGLVVVKSNEFFFNCRFLCRYTDLARPQPAFGRLRLQPGQIHRCCWTTMWRGLVRQSPHTLSFPLFSTSGRNHISKRGQFRRVIWKAALFFLKNDNIFFCLSVFGTYSRRSSGMGPSTALICPQTVIFWRFSTDAFFSRAISVRLRINLEKILLFSSSLKKREIVYLLFCLQPFFSHVHQTDCCQ